MVMYVFDFDIKHTHEILNETIRVQFLKEHDHMRQGHLILCEYLLRYRVTALHYEVVKPFLLLQAYVLFLAQPT